MHLVAGQFVTCGVTWLADLYCWGEDVFETGLLGLGSGVFEAKVPTQVGRACAF